MRVDQRVPPMQQKRTNPSPSNNQQTMHLRWGERIMGRRRNMPQGISSDPYWGDKGAQKQKAKGDGGSRRRSKAY